MPLHPMLEKIRASGHLPSPKGVALQVIELTRKDDVSNQEIARAIKSDPALASRVIKMANALMAYQSRPIVSMGDAVAVLGLNTVRQMILGLSLLDDSRNVICQGFDYQAFWGRALLTAIATQNLVRSTDLGSPEEVFILGLLAQIGTLALAAASPHEYARVIEKAKTGAEPDWAGIERAELGFDHNHLTQAMLADWGMPRIFQEIALHHENPDKSSFAKGSRNWRLLQVLHIAEYFSRLCLAPEQYQRKMVPKLILIATRLGVELDNLTRMGDQSIREWNEWGKLCGIRTAAIPHFASLLEAVPLAPDMLEIGEELPSDTSTFYKLRILLVDDDRAILFLLKTLLENAGHSVITARNGVEALSMLEKSTPQLIMTDWIMPEMDGIEFCKVLRKNPLWRNIYVFILTAQESTDRLVEAFEAGANDYMIKPINTKVLGARLRAGQRVVQLQEELEFDRQQLHKFADELAASNQRLQLLALTDELTGLPNRRFANEHLERQWALSARNERPLTCMLVDIDHFKQINDTHGHKIGDDALKQVAHILRGGTRTEDVVCRFGGEEFLLICPDITAEQAYQYAERLRHHVASKHVAGDNGQSFHLTISIGIARKKPAMLNTEMLLQLADKRLYAAKHGGRNRTVSD